MMKIRFGYGLDLEIVDDVRPSFGEVVVGLKGMLSLLESQLGLAGSDASFTTRLVQYHQSLQVSLNSSRFYHDSFQADPFASTKALLDWRDELYLSGWNGQFKSEVPSRLKDLEDVEKQAQGFVEKGEGERLQQVLRQLEQQRVQIAEIELVDPLELLPPMWQKVISVLQEHHDIAIYDMPSLQNSCTDKSDLGLLQKALINSQERADDASNKVQLSGDISVLIVKAGATAFSASSMSKLLHHAQQVEKAGDFCLLAEQNGASLDAALEYEGLLRLGFQANSPWRPAFQVLPLCFELLWQPLDPKVLLQFLNHPVGPIPRRIRKSLSQVVASEPGIGGERWTHKIASLLEAEREADPKQAKKLEQQINYWLHSERYQPELGMPTQEAIKVTEQLSQWLSGMQISFEGKPEVSLYTAALHQVQELGLVLGDLNNSGMTVIDREILRHLIEDVRGGGTGLVDRVAEVGPDYPAIQKAESAASILSSRETIIWWDCHKQGGIRKSHWLPVEKKALAAEGIQLWSEQKQLTLQGRGWLRPILNAKKQLSRVNYFVRFDDN
ncbi:MAG: hypothetical protein DRQ61_07150 [Gammaproteobacteria bacterium]|nr:MAG: hypothetical protein DRQ61_07150 [Gammaproteobacteria bacterium]